MFFEKDFIDVQLSTFKPDCPMIHQDSGEVKTWLDWVNNLNYYELEDRAAERYEFGDDEHVPYRLVEEEAETFLEKVFEAKKDECGSWVMS